MIDDSAVGRLTSEVRQLVELSVRDSRPGIIAQPCLGIVLG